MDFKRSIRRSVIQPLYGALEDLYPHNLQLYTTPPNFEISLKELEECTSQRLAILQTMDEVLNRGLKGDEWRQTVFSELRKQDLRNFRKLITNTSFSNDEELYATRKQDHISHFMLRLAYCDTEDKRRWFIAREMDLFKFKWSYLNQYEKQQFLKINNFNYEVLEETEKLELSKNSYGMIQTSTDYYKVPFVTVSDLVRARKVYLSKGMAYIVSDDMSSVIASSYRSSLSKSLSFAARRIDDIAEDTRIFSLVKGAAKRERDVDYTPANNGKVDINNLDTLSKISFPLCMQQLHQRLRKEHHLKHFARLQYILFIKGIGVTLEDALRFWKSEFTKKVDPEKFDKSYAYNVRHSYGKVGKMANYSPQSCLKIISCSVGPGEAHGCPFKHQDQGNLKKTLVQNGLSSIDSQEVLDFVRRGHYQIACGIYFQKMHGVDKVIINHPNHYFDESQMVLNNKKVKTEIKEEHTTHPMKHAVKNEEHDVWGNDSGFDFNSFTEIN
ncbi:DNA primase large subunit [Halyomorpha halys]|uniref:DNA primase large subunit n=1 Tax=Halyomorpha halys TaxID=286706 RepID=UPI0006D4FABA|nr:DNA primase large subunit-like [Halyomorpha halys]